MDRRLILSPESAEASEIFDKFCSANTLKGIISHYRQLCHLLRIKATHFPDFYPRLKTKLCSWRAQGLWTKIEKRASAKCYGRGTACASSRVLIIGAGPCGLRTAIEAQLLGAKVVLIEKRDRLSRNNVLHLWPFVITDLKGLGAKKFYGKFCAGSIDHISIRQIQCLLLKVALLLGVEVHEGVGFEGLSEPSETEGWKALTSPIDHPVSHYHFDVLIGADGRRNTLEGFRRKALRAKLAIAITVNFINKRTEAEARVKEISGVSYIFNQKFFQDLNEATGIDLENIVYYKDETHYFVMTAKKQSLLAKGVLLQDHADTSQLLSPENISRENLMIYAVEAALFSTENQLPDLEFAVNHYGQPDVAMFDFTAMYAAENASRVVQRRGHKLMMTLVGDSLLEPFWPTGSGCARGFLSSFDACWMLRSWASGTKGILEVIAERESIYRLLGQTTPENLNKEHAGYTTDPHSRYPNLNLRVVMPFQVKNLFDTDETFPDDVLDSPLEIIELERQRPKRRRDSVVAVDSLLSWLRTQVSSTGLEITDVYDAFGRGEVLWAIIYRFRPDLIDFPILPSEENVDPLQMAAVRNQVAFDVLQSEYGIPPVMSGPESVQTESLDFLLIVSYLSQLYEVFKGEIPQIEYLRVDGSDEGEELSNRSTHGHGHHPPKHGRSPTLLLKHGVGPRREGVGRRSRLPSSSSRESRGGDGEVSEISKRHRKRRNEDKRSSFEDRERRREEIERNRQERERRRMRNLILQRERFLRSMELLALSDRRDDAGGDTYEDYTMHLYRQTAPDWGERCKSLEQKLFYSGKEQRAPGGGSGLSEVEKFVPGLARDLEEKLKGSKLEKKPKDLIRAIGKLEKSDWNVQLIEKKIAENKGHGTRKSPGDKVPKWSREAFDDKREAMKRRMEGGDRSGEKDTVFEDTMKNLGRRLKEGNTLDIGQRGSNKVSQMAEQIVDRFGKRPKEPDDIKPIVTRPVFEPKKGGSETCHFCDQRVYVVERMTAEGKFFHRNCFRCEYCNTSLRLGNYSFDREGRYGERFYCAPHFHYIRHFGWKKYDQEERTPSQPPLAEGSNRKYSAGEEGRRVLLSPQKVSELLAQMEDRGTTPERVEFENSLDFASEEELLSEMDEDEWTDRNFGPSHGDDNTSDEASDLSEDEDDEVTPEGANDETGKANAPLHAESSGSDTEVASGESSPDSASDDEGEEEDEDEEEECGGSTTEIETDSEFAEDPPQSVPGWVPTIVVQEPEQLLARFFCLHPKVDPPNTRPGNQVKANPPPPQSPQVYEELRLVEPLPRITTRESRALPRVYAIPKKWEPLPEQTRTQDVLAASKANELKKQYLHGGVGTPGPNPKKAVDSATQNQFSSVLDMISEQQKLLQPAPKPSPAMQAFLEGTEKLKNQNSRFSTPHMNNEVTSPRANQLPPWSQKPAEMVNPDVSKIPIGDKTIDMNRINNQKSLHTESEKCAELSPSGLNEKGDPEKEIHLPSASPLPTMRGNEMVESCDSIGAPFPNSESTTESQQTIVPAEPKNDGGTETESGDSSGADLTMSDLDDDLEEERNLLSHPPRVEIEDEFGVTLALELVQAKKTQNKKSASRLSSADSKDSLNSALYLETEMSDWADDERGGRRQSPKTFHREEEPLGLDFDSLAFVDMDELSSPDELLRSISRTKGYARLFEEELEVPEESPNPEEGSGSSLNESSSTPTPGSITDGIIQLPFKEIEGGEMKTSKSTESQLALHARVIPFSNAVDSLDYRKMKGVGTSPVRNKDLFSMYLPPVPARIEPAVDTEEDQPHLPPEEEKSFKLLDTDTKCPNSPGIARKLDEISKERAKESELIRLMVMGRIRKNRRGSRGSLANLVECSSPPSSSSEPHAPSLPSSLRPTGRQGEEAEGYRDRRQSHPISSPLRMVESVTNPPTPVNPAVSLFSPQTPPSDWDELGKSPSPSFYGSLPNISLVLGNSRNEAQPSRVTKVSSFLSPNPKKWDDYKHLVSADRERAREAARERARLKSDEELGLSPKGTYGGLKEKILRRKLSVPQDQVFSSQIPHYENETALPRCPLSREPGTSNSLQERLPGPGLGKSSQEQIPVAASIRHNVDFPMKKSPGDQECPDISVPPPAPPRHHHHHYKRTFSLDSKMGKENTAK